MKKIYPDCILLLILMIIFVSCRSYNIYKSEKIAKLSSSTSYPEDYSEFENYVSKIKEKTILTLQDCYALALLNNEKLKIVYEDYIQAIIEKDKAYSLIYPTLKLRWQHFRQETVPSFGGSSFSPKSRTESWLTFNQPLFSGLKDIYTLRAAKANIMSKKYLLQYEKTEIFILVVSTFYEILKIQQHIETLRNFLNARKERLNELKEKQKAGLVRETEVLLVETQIEETNTLLTQAVNTLNILKSRMENLTGVDVTNKVFVDTFEEENKFSLEELIEKAYNNRYDLKSQEARLAALKEQLKAIKGEYLPTITFNNNTYLKRAGAQREIDWDAVIVAELPIFEGFLTKSKIKESESKIRQAQYTYELLKKTIKEDVEMFYYELKSNDAVIAQLEKQVEFAKKNYELLKEEYNQKIATNLELLYADVNLQEAKIKLEAEKLNRKALQLKLKTIVGEEVFKYNTKGEK